MTTPEIQTMRRLLYCGEWIESHALHIFMLHAPDFLGYDSVIEMAADHGPVVEMALRLKKAGNDLMELVGGRAIHPVNVKVGGFYRMPTKAEMLKLRPAIERGVEEAFETIKLVSTFDFPDMEQPYEYVALRHPDYYAIERGTVVSTSGVEFPVSDFPKHIKEFHVEHSNALHAKFDDTMYMVGPLARYTLNFEQLSDRCKKAALAAGLEKTCRNQFKSIIVRAVELAYAFEEALRIIDEWKDGPAPSVPVKAAKGEGMGASEAPRGIIFHRYVTDANGHHPGRPDRPADVAEPAEHRARPQDRGAAVGGHGRPHAHPPLRARDPQLRPLHLLRDALPRPEDQAVMTAKAAPRGGPLVVGLGSPDQGDDAVGPAIARAVAGARASRASKRPFTRTRRPSSTCGGVRRRGRRRRGHVGKARGIHQRDRGGRRQGPAPSRVVGRDRPRRNARLRARDRDRAGARARASCLAA